MTRLDVELVQRGLARSRTAAQVAIAAGKVAVAGQPATKPAQPVTASDPIAMSGADHYVSRAAHKLLGALDESGTAVPARVLDAGASTGGFTQVCLERGARRVYAIDVGHGQLAPELRSDPRVVVKEHTNLRDLGLDQLDAEPVGLVVADVSFISLRLLLEPLLAVLAPTGTALLLVKPQFEVGRAGLDGHGVVRDERLRAGSVDRVSQAAAALGWQTGWRGRSGLPGENGNVEFFLKLTRRLG
ncbi:MAG: TlyA family RNA methyltransferase [Propionicimonas sp.]|uniref:TlyA family RNA methyltransferase n=1 Tax=Propionicimonas sp. TaxID=1955623 RepID=UPI002B203158|nr:TlyA family RNA methyltransferase [Propionicimonas sp.]MEA4945354.1 TlyA family RNA methyltransferase [Propionicimonas sp.]